MAPPNLFLKDDEWPFYNTGGMKNLFDAALAS